MNTACGGNVRELENAIEHALAMKSGLVIKPDNLPVQIVTEGVQCMNLSVMENHRKRDRVGTHFQICQFVDHTAASGNHQ
jgi:DNA-binding NtrC family response regulator